MLVNYGFLAITMTSGLDDLQLQVTYIVISYILLNIAVNWLLFLGNIIYFLFEKVKLRYL